MKRELPALFYKLLIIAATIIWGFSFVVVKDAVDAVSPAWLMGMRFVATAAILAVVFHETLHANLSTSHLFAGVVLGVLSFLGFWIQTIGITDTTPGRNAFLTATYCVMVPFLYWIVAKRRPTVFNLVAAVMCIAGVGFVSLGGDFTFTMRWGRCDDPALGRVLRAAYGYGARFRRPSRHHDHHHRANRHKRPVRHRNWSTQRAYACFLGAWHRFLGTARLPGDFRIMFGHGIPECGTSENSPGASVAFALA